MNFLLQYRAQKREQVQRYCTINDIHRYTGLHFNQQANKNLTHGVK